MTKDSSSTESIWLPTLCFFACVSSIDALLAKLYGLASMQVVTFAATVPCCAGLVGAWAWGRRSGRERIADALAIGFWGGLFGTIAYDLARIPFHMAGQRIFAPISSYGVWITEAEMSSRMTEVVGWTYHFSNGITFGIMYALFKARRHWGWAVLWGLMLETLAILSPFGRVFSLWGNYYAIGIAYLGHVAYGLPLGWLVYRWDNTREQLAEMTVSTKWLATVLAGVALLWPLVSPEWVRQDARATKREFRVEGRRLNPDWLRIERGEDIRVFNPEAESVLVRVKQYGEAVPIARSQKATFSFPKPGIYQVFVQTDLRSHSSFVIVEPVEELE